MLAIVISILALVVSCLTSYALLFNTKHRAAHQFIKNYQKVRQYPHSDSYRKARVIPITWLGTAFHIRADLLNAVTHTVDMYYAEARTVSEALMYAVLKDFKKVSDNNYQLLIEDPFGEVWTHYATVARTFIEENLDKVIRIEAEFVHRELEKGVVRFSQTNNNDLMLIPIQVTATGLPKVIFDFDLEELYEK